MPEDTCRVQKDFSLREANEVSRGLLLSSGCWWRGVGLWTMEVVAARLAKGLLLVVACCVGSLGCFSPEPCAVGNLGRGWVRMNSWTTRAGGGGGCGEGTVRKGKFLFLVLLLLGG